MTRHCRRLLTAPLLLLLIGGCASNRKLANTWPQPAPGSELAGTAAPPATEAYAGRFPGVSPATPAAQPSREQQINVALEQAYQAEVAAAAAEARQSAAESQAAYQQARAAYARVLALHPEHGYTHHRLATIADKEGRFADAEQHYLAALQQSPRDCDLLSDLGYSYQLQGRYDASERILNDALRIQPDHRGALFNLGALYARGGNAELALATFRRGGTEAEAQAALAQALAAARTPAATLAGTGVLPPGDALGATLPDRNPALAGTSPTPANDTNLPANPFQVARGDDKTPSRATLQIAEEMKRLREQQVAQQARSGATGKPERPAAAPGSLAQAAPPAPPAIPPRGRPPLNPAEVPPERINDLFSHLDSRSDTLTQANRPRRADDPQTWGTQPPPLSADPRLSAPASSGPALTAPGAASGSPHPFAAPAGGQVEAGGGVRQLSGSGSPYASNSPVVPAYGVAEPGAPGVAAGHPQAPAGAAAPRNAWEQANRQAALMGLNAGPGTALFPLADTAAPAAQGGTAAPYGQSVAAVPPAAANGAQGTPAGWNQMPAEPGPVTRLGFETDSGRDVPQWNHGDASTARSGPVIRPIPTSPIQQLSGYGPDTSHAPGGAPGGGVIFRGTQQPQSAGTAPFNADPAAGNRAPTGYAPPGTSGFPAGAYSGQPQAGLSPSEQTQYEPMRHAPAAYGQAPGSGRMPDGSAPFAAGGPTAMPPVPGGAGYAPPQADGRGYEAWQSAQANPAYQSQQFQRQELAPAPQNSQQWHSGTHALTGVGTGQFASPHLNSAQSPQWPSSPPAGQPPLGQFDAQGRAIAGTPANLTAPPAWNMRNAGSGAADGSSAPAGTSSGPAGAGGQAYGRPPAAPGANGVPAYQSNWSAWPGTATGR